MSDDLSPRDLAVMAIEHNPDATNQQLGAILDGLIDVYSTDHLLAFRHARLTASLARYAADVKAGLNAERAPSLSYNGMAMSPGISVRTAKGNQMKLWTECSPGEFIEAVMREQNVVDGRGQSNAVRLAFVGLLREKPELMKMETLGAAIAAAGWDADDLALTDLDEVAT